MDLHFISTQLLADVKKLRSLLKDYEYLPSSLTDIATELEALWRLLRELERCQRPEVYDGALRRRVFLDLQISCAFIHESVSILDERFRQDWPIEWRQLIRNEEISRFLHRMEKHKNKLSVMCA